MSVLDNVREDKSSDEEPRERSVRLEKAKRRARRVESLFPAITHLCASGGFLCVCVDVAEPRAVKKKKKSKGEDAGEEAAGRGPERRGHAGRRRPAQKLLVLLEHQDIPDLGMRPHVGAGHRGSVPGEWTLWHRRDPAAVGRYRHTFGVRVQALCFVLFSALQSPFRHICFAAKYIYKRIPTVSRVY